MTSHLFKESRDKIICVRYGDVDSVRIGGDMLRRANATWAGFGTSRNWGLMKEMRKENGE